MLCIDRCVCQKTLFATLLPLAREHDWDLDAVMELTGCGDQCGMCRPYLRAMLATGTTVFNEIMPLTEEDT
jgi:bacterioferritin-associated ferredoxin